MRQRELRWHRKIAAVTVLIAVWILWFTLYRSAAYPPPLDVWLAIVGALFLGALTLLHRIHAREWPGIARCGFLVSVFGLSMWVVGGTMSGLAVAGDDCRSTASRFMFEVLRAPQAGWGLFCAGLMPIGAAAVMNGSSRPMRLLLPLGGLLLLGPPLKYVLGERAGGLAVLVLFGVGWLAIGALLVVEHRDTSGLTVRSAVARAGAAWAPMCASERSARLYVRSKVVGSVLASWLVAAGLRCADQADFAERHTVARCAESPNKRPTVNAVCQTRVGAKSWQVHWHRWLVFCAR